VDHLEAILPEIASPPLRVEEPQFRYHVPALSMASLQEAARCVIKGVITRELVNAFWRERSQQIIAGVRESR
jgi:hypothetical protein